MAETVLKSSQFREEREGKWRELEALVDRIEQSGIHVLTSDEVIKLQSLYRATLSSLSVARSISLDRGVLVYLEALSARAYFCVYGPRSRLSQAIYQFFRVDFPRVVRAIKYPIFLSALAMFLGVAVGFALTYDAPDWYYAFVSEAMSAGREPATSVETLREGLFDGPEVSGGRLSLFSSYLFTHNAKIGFLAFALGFAFGVPTVLLLISNGLMLGAMCALYVSKGLGLEFTGWLFIHGTTELLAIILCGGAGLAIGGAAIFPGRQTRLASLISQGRKCGYLVCGAVTMFLIAGVLEGFGRQLITDTFDRYLIGTAALSFWLAYFTSLGRNHVGLRGPDNE